MEILNRLFGDVDTVTVICAAFLSYLAFGFLRSLFGGLRLASAVKKERELLQIDDEALKQQFHLVTAAPAPERQSAIREAYAELARMEDWSSFHDRLRRDDASGELDSANGRRAARIGVDVAMAELHAAVGHGGDDAEKRVAALIEDGFEARLAEAPDDLAAAVLAAEAHMEMGWLYRGGGTIDTVSSGAMSQMQRHFERAEEIIRSFEVARRGSALLAAANFRLQVGLCNDETLFHSARAIWLKADPSDPEMMNQVAFHMLPRWYGSYPELHSAAAQIADHSPLGDRAYAMTLFSVAWEEPELVEAVDAARLVRGAEAMIEADRNDLEAVNYVASCLLSLMMNAVGSRRVILRDGLREILQTRMRAFMLDFWPSSIAELRLVLAPLFGKELNDGATITIDEQGFRIA